MPRLTQRKPPYLSPGLIKSPLKYPPRLAPPALLPYITPGFARPIPSPPYGSPPLLGLTPVGARPNMVPDENSNPQSVVYHPYRIPSWSNPYASFRRVGFPLSRGCHPRASLNLLYALA